LRPRRLCRRSARRRTDFCRPLGPPPHHAVRPSGTHDARSITPAGWSDVSSRVSAGVGVRKVAVNVPASLRRFCAVSRPTTSPPRGAAPHHAYASRATPRSWSGLRPRMHAPAACRLSSLRSEQAETHHGEVASTRDKLQEHHERLPDYAHNGRGDACGYDDGHHAHGRVLEHRRCGTLPTQMGSAAAHTRNLQRGLGPIADSRRRPRPPSRNASVSLPLTSV